MDMDIPHSGARGGSMRKRYFGQLEGVDPMLKSEVVLAASKSGKSVNEWMENVISRALLGSNSCKN
jgi:predicted HicB family RNase H-like nuclease